MGEPEDARDVMRVNEVLQGYASGHGASLAASPDALSTRVIFRPDRHVVYTCKTKQGTPAVLATPRQLLSESSAASASSGSARCV